MIPACRDLPPLLRILGILERCDPRPAEILVHVDGGSVAILTALQTRHPSVKILISNELLGPGGSRNRLVSEARNEWVANFDDDSFPSHSNYFGRVAALIDRFPQAAIFSAASHPAEWQSSNIEHVGIFSGCGCVFRKSFFAKMGGFVPLPVAYGMEEVDLSVRTHAAGGLVVHDPWLRVRHEQMPNRARNERAISSSVLANSALFPLLRFPWWLVGLGLYQFLMRIVWMLKRHELGSLLQGLSQTPNYLWRHRCYRSPVSARSLLSWFKLRQQPMMLANGLELPQPWKADTDWKL